APESDRDPAVAAGVGLAVGHPRRAAGGADADLHQADLRAGARLGMVRADRVALIAWRTHGRSVRAGNFHEHRPPLARAVKKLGAGGNPGPRGWRHSPGDALAIAVEAAGDRFGHAGRPDDAGGAFGHRAAARATHVGGDPAGADRIDLDAAALEFAGQGARIGVQRRLGDAIRRAVGAVAGAGAAAAGDIDDAAIVMPAHQR